MLFVPSRPPGPNLGQRAALRAAMQAQRAARRARRPSAAPDPARLPAPSVSVASSAARPSAFGAALPGALGGFIILLIFAVMDRFAAPPQLGSALLLYAASAVALLMGYRITTGTGRLGPALLCGALLGLGMALLGLLTFLTFSRGLPASALTLYLTRAEVGAIRTLLLLAGVALAGGASAKVIQMLRDRQV